MDKVRIDKWLWSVRIYKTRTMAANACKSGKVKLNEKQAKPSQMVQREDKVYVKKNGINLTFKVVELIEKRVSAKLAQPCYENLTPASELNKFRDWYVANSAAEIRDRGAGRPTKKERREIDVFKVVDKDEHADSSAWDDWENWGDDEVE